MCSLKQAFPVPVVVLVMAVVALALATPDVPARTADRDTLNLYGGPGTLQGKFQDADGQPDTQDWKTVDETELGAGSYGQLRANLGDADADQDNLSPQWCFLDDGIVVECSGPSYCTYDPYCYGPDGLVTNQDGGCLGPYHYIQCSVLSPLIALPQEAGHPVLSFDIYEHNGPFPFDDPLLSNFQLELSNDPEGLVGWHVFSDDFMHASTEGRYSRITYELPADEMPAAAVCARVRLSVREMPIFSLGNSTPAPYFDNVRVQWIPDTAAAGPPAADSLQARAYPNPFNPAVTIAWTAPEGSAARVSVHDLAGRQVAGLFDGIMTAGTEEATWNGRLQDGTPAAAGMYLGKIEAGNQQRLLKLMLVK